MDFNTLPIAMDKSSRQKIHKEAEASNDTLGQIDVIDIYRHSIQKLQNIVSSEVLTEHSPG